MNWSTQTELPLKPPRPNAGQAGRMTTSNRGAWSRVSKARGAEQEGRPLAARTPSRRTERKPPPARDLLTCVALADVSPEVREALASFGQAIEAGFLARNRREAPRQAWWNRD